MLGFKYVALLLLLNGMRCYGQSSINELCTVAYNGIMLADPSDCHSYYVCNSGVATSQTCNTGFAFSKDSQKCVVESQANCNTLDLAPCAGKASTFTPNPNDCNAYYYCDGNSVAYPANCPSGQNFDGTTNSCIYASQSPCINDPTTVTVTDVCYFMPNNVFFGNPNDCSAYEICVNNQALQGTCNTCDSTDPTCVVLYFDVQKQGCNYGSKINNLCAQVSTPTAPDVGPTCTGSGNTYDGIPDGSQCNEYYNCNGKNYVLTTCTPGKFYDTTTNTCVVETSAVNPTCNRCTNHNSGFVAAPEGPNYYYTCVNGKATETEASECPDTYYFNQAIQACVENNPAYACCVGDSVTSSGEDSQGSNPDNVSPETDEETDEDTEETTEDPDE